MTTTSKATQLEPEADPEATWSVQLQSVDRAKRLSRAVFNETVRDASRAGLNPTQIARQLGTTDRRSIYELNSRDRSEEESVLGAERPPLQPVIFLRGAKASSDTWGRIQQAMWRRGWHTVMSRGDAFHLARGRVPVILVDFSSRVSKDVKVGVVRAKFGDNGKTELPVVTGTTIQAPLQDGELDVDAVAMTVQEVIGQTTKR